MRAAAAAGAALLWLLAARSARGAEWRAAAGAELSTTSFGILDLGVRQGDWSAQLLTDTLDLRWAPEGPRGRGWAALRAEFGAAQLLISPWEDGAPAPARAQRAAYAGPEAGFVAYLPAGLYAGLQGEIRRWWFGAPEEGDGMADHLRAVPEAILGWWTPHTHGYLRGGAAWAPALDRDVQPHVHLRVVHRVERWRLAPRAALHAGRVWDSDRVSQALVGGLNPYVVPLAGAAWGELRADRYAAARLGPSAILGDWQLDAVVDLVVGDHRPLADRDRAGPGGGAAEAAAPFAHLGFGLLGAWHPGRLFIDGGAGVAPWLPRAGTRGLGSLAGSLWLRGGVDWGEGRP